MKGKIRLGEMRFYAFHGVLPEEKTIGAEFGVEVQIELDLSKSVVSDQLSDTIDYGEIYNLVEDEMKISSNLIEHVAGRILNKLISDNFPQIRKAIVKITKYNPPVNANMEKVSVEMGEKSKR